MASSEIGSSCAHALRRLVFGLGGATKSPWAWRVNPYSLFTTMNGIGERRWGTIEPLGSNCASAIQVVAPPQESISRGNCVQSARAQDFFFLGIAAEHSIPRRHTEFFGP